MLKTLKYFLMAFLFLLLITIAPLLMGIKIDNLNYKNLSFNGLYLKYDKSLIVSVDKFTIISQSGKKTSMSFSAKLESFFDTYFIDVKEYTLDDPHLKFSGKVLLTNVDFEDFTTAKFYINDFKFLWDKNLDFLKASQAFVEYKNRSFYFSFKNPIYKDFKIDGTTASITDIIEDPYLNMDFYSKDRFKKSLTNLISYYGVDLPIVQEYGKNNTYTKVNVPLTLKKLDKNGVDVFVDVDLKSSKLFLFGKPVYAKNINVLFQNNIATIKGTLEKKDYENEKYRFVYKGHINLDLDFTTKTGKGIFEFENVKFEKADFGNIAANINANFQEQLQLDFIFEDNLKLKFGENDITIDDINSFYKNGKVFTTLKAKQNHFNYELYLNDSFDINKSISSGVAKVNIKNGDLKASLDNIKYNFIFADDIIIDFNTSNQKLQYKNNTLFLNSVIGNYSKDTISFQSDAIAQFLDQNIHLKKLLGNYNLKNKSLHFGIKKAYSDSFELVDIKGEYLKNLILFENNLSLKKFDLKGQMQTNIDLEAEKINGEFLLHSFYNKSFSDSLEFKIDYNDKVTVAIPALTLSYHKNQVNHIFQVDDIDRFFLLKSYFKTKNITNKIKDKTKGNIYIHTKDFDQYSIYFNNTFIDLDILNSIAKLNEKNQTTSNDLKLNIFSKNGVLKYKSFLFLHDTIRANFFDNTFKSNLVSNKTAIDFNIDKKNLYTIKAENIQNSYLNSIVGKKILYDGMSSFNIVGYKNIFKGDMFLSDTTIKDVAALNSLILFINTTPALINPFLSIPSLFRFSQTGFSINGYEIDKGNLHFTYRKDHNKLFVNDFTLDGKMNDFKGFFTIDGDSKAVDGKVDIVFMKDYAKIINYIPGAKFLNSDKNVVFYKTVNIGGTVDDPKFSLNEVKKD